MGEKISISLALLGFLIIGIAWVKIVNSHDSEMLRHCEKNPSCVQATRVKR